MPLCPQLMLGIFSLSVLECYMKHCLLVTFLMYISETMLWKEKERLRIKAVLMDNLRSLLGIRRVDRVPNALIRENDRIA